MRKNDIERMTIVEQIASIKEETCNTVCMFKEYAESEYEDKQKSEEFLKGYCLKCPLNRLHFSDVLIGSNPEHSFGDSQTPS